MSADKYTYKADGSIETINGVPIEQVLDRAQEGAEAEMYAHLYDGEDYRTVEKRQLLGAAPRFWGERNPLLPRRRVWPWIVAAGVLIAALVWQLS